MHLHKISLLAGVVALTSASAPALAGGLGLMGAAGMHQENVYFYDNSDTQYLQVQYQPSYGSGLYVMLGDRDDRVQGVMKMYWLRDAPPSYDVGPLPDGFDGDEAIIALREDSRDIGIATAGIQWSLFGDPAGLSVNLLTNIGAAAVTRDLTEFAYAEIGPGVSFALDSSIQVFGEVLYQPRFRKVLTHGGGGSIGVRYLFD